MTPEGTMAFTSYKFASQNLVHEIVETLCILPVEDCGEDNASHYNLLQQERVQEYEKLKPLIYAAVSRKNIIMIWLIYKKNNTASHQLHEEASGDGVTRDAFSAFFLHQFT